MEFLTEKPEITAKNYLSVGPGEYPCGNNLFDRHASLVLELSDHVL
jgi:hypothetical protein